MGPILERSAVVATVGSVGALLWYFTNFVYPQWRAGRTKATWLAFKGRNAVELIEALTF